MEYRALVFTKGHHYTSEQCPEQERKRRQQSNKNSKESFCDAYGEYRWKFMCCLPIKVKLLRVVCGGALYC